MVSIFLPATILMRLISTLSAYDFHVGGRDGWADCPKEFQVNDKLAFKYKKGEESVLLVRKEDYDSCNVKNPIHKLEGGDSVFQFKRSGTFYFISGLKRRCVKGHKVVIVVPFEREKKPVPSQVCPPPPVFALQPPPKPAPSPIPIEAPTPSPSPIPIEAPTPSPTPTEAPTPSPSEAPTPSPSPVEAPTPSPSEAPTPSPSPTEAPTLSPTTTTEAPTPSSTPIEAPTPSASTAEAPATSDSPTEMPITPPPSQAPPSGAAPASDASPAQTPSSNDEGNEPAPAPTSSAPAMPFSSALASSGVILGMASLHAILG